MNQEPGGIAGRLTGVMRSSLLRNSSFIMAATIVNGALGFVYWTIIARASHASDVGLASAVIAAFTLTSLLANVGIAQLLIQVLPKLNDDESWSSFVTVGLGSVAAFATVVGLLAGCILPLLSPNFAELRRPEVLALFAIGAGASTAAIGLDAVYVASRRSEQMLIRNLAFGTGKALLILAALPLVGMLHSSVIVTSWVAGLVISLVFGACFLIPRVRAGARPSVRGGLRPVVRWWKSMTGHHIANVGGILVPFLLPILVVIRLSAQANAFYYLTWSVGAIFFMVSPAVATSLFAEGSHGEQIKGNVRRCAIFIGAILVPAIVFTMVFSYQILLIFGRQYAVRGSTLLVLLAFSAIPDAITNIAVSVLRVEGRLRTAATLNLSMAAIAIGLTWVLLPHFGILAPGIAWITAQTTGALAVGIGAIVPYRVAGRPGRAPEAGA